jgi:hypothetical protein
MEIIYVRWGFWQGKWAYPFSNRIKHFHKLREILRKESKMEIKKALAWWSKVCPGCNIGRKYPESFIGKKVRNHWEKGCISHNAYVEVYDSEEPSPKKSKGEPDNK